ncbi:MAG: type II secretion system F family protein [Opitutus sp.]|nr:type II secretion system F family protein [Opitutus sp.]
MAKLAVRPASTTPVPATFAAKAPSRTAVTFPVGGTAAKKRRRPITFGRPVNGKGLAVFTRQLATLVKAGMPILRSLEVLARQEKRPAFKEVIENIGDAIRSGGNFSDGLAANEKVFDRLYINMVKAGEAGGVLDTVLERLAVFMEKAQRIAGKVKAAMVYPVIIVIVASLIVSVLMIFVIPTFKNIFRDMLKGQPLPALTEGLMIVSNFLKEHYVYALAGLPALYVLYRLFSRTRFGARLIDWLLIHAPVVGDLFLKSAIARFTRTFGTLLASGVPILQALVITRDTSGNVHVANAINVVHDRVKEGDNVAKPLESTHIFPGMVTSMIEVGEETGALPDMLTRIADTYDEEVDTAVAGLTSIIEPIMIVFMAVVVGLIVVALFLPMVSIIQNLPT